MEYLIAKKDGTRETREIEVQHLLKIFVSSIPRREKSERKIAATEINLLSGIIITFLLSFANMFNFLSFNIKHYYVTNSILMTSKIQLYIVPVKEELKNLSRF